MQGRNKRFLCTHKKFKVVLLRLKNAAHLPQTVHCQGATHLFVYKSLMNPCRQKHPGLHSWPCIILVQGTSYGSWQLFWHFDPHSKNISFSPRQGYWAENNFESDQIIILAITYRRNEQIGRRKRKAVVAAWLPSTFVYFLNGDV